MSGAAVSIVIFGIGFGIAARHAGMEGWIATGMSALVFAGGAQFAALDFWHAPLPWIPLLLATVAVNARHILYGATLHSWFSKLSPIRRYAAVALLSDANWASSIRAFDRGERDVGHLIGGGILLWTTWVLGTVLGIALGAQFGEPERFGLDVILPAFFACMLIDLAKDRSDALPWSAAALSALAAIKFLPPHWHLLVGAIVGGVVGAVINARR